jgi:hypothetical protein
LPAFLRDDVSKQSHLSIIEPIAGPATVPRVPGPCQRFAKPGTGKNCFTGGRRACPRPAAAPPA